MCIIRFISPRMRLKLNTGNHIFSDVSLLLFFVLSLLPFLEIVSITFCRNASFICDEASRRLIQTLV